MMTKNYGNNFCWPQLAGKKFSPINKGQIGSVTKKWWKFFVNYSCCFAVSWQFHRKSLDSQQNTLIFAKKTLLERSPFVKFYKTVFCSSVFCHTTNEWFVINHKHKGNYNEFGKKKLKTIKKTSFSWKCTNGVNKVLKERGLTIYLF